MAIASIGILPGASFLRKGVGNMANKSLQLWAAVLLLVGGLVHLIPALYTSLSDLTGGQPWIQIMIGILSIIVSLVIFAGDKADAGA